MATSDFWQKITENIAPSQQWAANPADVSSRNSRGMVALWMALDGITILASAALVTLYERQRGPISVAKNL